LRNSPPSDRALALGLLLLPSLPSLASLLPHHAVHAALLGLPGLLCAAVLAPAALRLGSLARQPAATGDAAPGVRLHTDGGQYDGQWLSGAKDGLGVYRYPSGAAFAGGWLRNRKHGLGVHCFADGGSWAGEWREGRQGGLGVRLYASGRPPSAARWVDGEVAEQLPLRDAEAIAAAARSTAEAAEEAAEEAAPPSLGQSLSAALLTPAAAAAALCLAPYGLAALSAVASRLAGVGAEGGARLVSSALPPFLAAAAAPLADAHGALCLLALGISISSSSDDDGVAGKTAPTQRAFSLFRLPSPPALNLALLVLSLKYSFGLALLGAASLAIGALPSADLASSASAVLLAPLSPLALHLAWSARNSAAAAAPFAVLLSHPVSFVVSSLLSASGERAAGAALGLSAAGFGLSAALGRGRAGRGGVSVAAQCQPPHRGVRKVSLALGAGGGSRAARAAPLRAARREAVAMRMTRAHSPALCCLRALG